MSIPSISRSDDDEIRIQNFPRGVDGFVGVIKMGVVLEF
jgi:hypothetical protein